MHFQEADEVSDKSVIVGVVADIAATSVFVRHPL